MLRRVSSPRRLRMYVECWKKRSAANKPNHTETAQNAKSSLSLIASGKKKGIYAETMQ